LFRNDSHWSCRNLPSDNHHSIPGLRFLRSSFRWYCNDHDLVCIIRSTLT
jgi:hypothetical protein